MYKIPEENWGEFLSQGDKGGCWAYALGGIFGLTKQEEIERLHNTLGTILPDGTISSKASPEHVLIRAKEKGYINDYKSINYAYKPRRIQEIMKALEKGIPLYLQIDDADGETHEVRCVGFDEEKAQYLVIDSGRINYSPRTISYKSAESLYSVDLEPENYAKINADFKVETTEVETEINNEPETEIEAEGKKMAFLDVKESDWFYNLVKSCFDKGIVNGKNEIMFAPNDKTTRAETCAMIDRSTNNVKAEILKEVKEMIDKAIANAL